MTLTNFAFDPVLDMDPWVGQRTFSYTFQRIETATGRLLGQATPLRAGTLSHNAGATLSRNLTLELGATDTANINPLTESMDLSMIVGSTTYPLSRYVYTDESKRLWTSGNLASVTLVDQMFTVDQPISQGYSAVGKTVMSAIQDVMSSFSYQLSLEASEFLSTESWGIGTNLGQILQSLALSGDYFSPWFGNDSKLHFIRSFDPSTRIPDFDWDAGSKVLRDTIVETSDILTAPNKFVVVSNNAQDSTVPSVGMAEVPASAPHSIANRGFAITSVQTLQLSDSSQAFAVAQNLAQRQSVVERMTLSTTPDPRHDSYNVIKWQGALWLEIGWTLQLTPGGMMSHILRKTYSA